MSNLVNPVVIFAEPIHPVAMEQIGSLIPYHISKDPSEVAMINALTTKQYNPVALIVRGSLVPRSVLEACDTLCVIGRHGVGLNTVDIDAATELGIGVVNTPAANKISVVEHVLGFLFCLTKNYIKWNKETKAGCGTQIRKEEKNIELEGKLLGIVGLGNIGLELALRASTLGINILAYDPFTSNAEASNIEMVNSLDTLLRKSDFVSLHVPLTQSTTHLIAKKELDLMKPSAYLINAARGKVVDENALVEALRLNKIAGAALDVFHEDPAPKVHPLYAFDNVLVTPHIAARTEESILRVSETVAENVIAFLKGNHPTYLANPDIWKFRKIKKYNAFVI